MFARKDLEHDVLSAYQQHRRNLKKANSHSKPRDSQQPRTVPVETARHAEDAEGSMPTKVRRSNSHTSGNMLTASLQSPTSEVSSSYTYAKMDRSMEESRAGSSDEQVEGTTDHEREALARESEAHN